MKLYYQEKGITIYHGNCLEILDHIEPVDLILTDPPYNAKDIGTKHKKYENQIMQIPNKEYKKFCKQWFTKCKKLSKNIVFTPGQINCWFYPQPKWMICCHKPAAVSFNLMGGYNAWEPILIYGKPTQRINQDYILCNTLNFNKGAEKDHPCPKPIKLIHFLMQSFSFPEQTILDPFLGSGTSLIAAKNLGRKGIGIEQEEKYCEIAAKRLRQEVFDFNKSI